MRSTIQLSALCALLHYIAPSLALTTEVFYGPSETDRYMFYDATDECKNTDKPCITNFKHCSNLQSDDNMKYACPKGAKLDKSSDWIYLTGSQVFWWADTVDAPIPMFDTTKFAVSNYTLRWANTNPKYNTTVYLVSVPGDNYNDFGLSFETDFRLSTVIPAGKTEYSFQFYDMLERMVPEYHGLNASNWHIGSLMDEMKYSMVSGFNVAFAIGQPDDPKYQDRYNIVNLGDGNVTATSSPFRWSTRLVRHFITTKQDDEEASDKALKKKEHKWQLGVGVGVGLGIPIVAIVMFSLGLLLGKRSERKNGANINLVDVPKEPGED